MAMASAPSLSAATFVSFRFVPSFSLFFSLVVVRLVVRLSVSQNMSHTTNPAEAIDPALLDALLATFDDECLLVF